jgi:hypothetical protein
MGLALLVVGCGDGEGGLGDAGQGRAGADFGDGDLTTRPELTTTTTAPTTTAPPTTAAPTTAHSGPPGAFNIIKPALLNCTTGRPTTCQPAPFNAPTLPFTLEWAAAPGATGYSVELVAANGIDKRPLGPAPNRLFRIEAQHVNGCRNPCSWTYWVTATNAAGTSQSRLVALKV